MCVKSYGASLVSLTVFKSSLPCVPFLFLITVNFSKSMLSDIIWFFFLHCISYLTLITLFFDISRLLGRLVVILGNLCKKKLCPNLHHYCRWSCQTGNYAVSNYHKCQLAPIKEILSFFLQHPFGSIFDPWRRRLQEFLIG